MRAIWSSRPATDAGSSAGSRRTASPCSCSRAGRCAAPCSCASPLGESAVCVAMRRPLISVAINVFLERFDTDALHDVDEALGFAVALFQIALDQTLDHVRHVGAGERGSDDFAERGLRRPGEFPGAGLALVSADLDLVPLLAVLVDAEDADVTDVVVTAGIHAAGDVQVELADVVLVVEIVEAALQRLGDRDRLGVRERAEIPARARDDVRDQPQVRRREPQAERFVPERGEVALAHVGEDQVLLVRYAQLAAGGGCTRAGSRPGRSAGAARAGTPVSFCGGWACGPGRRGPGP